MGDVPRKKTPILEMPVPKKWYKRYDKDNDYPLFWDFLDEQLSQILSAPSPGYDFVPIEWGQDGASPPAATETFTNGNGSVQVRKFAAAADQDLLIPWEVPTNMLISEGILFTVVGFFTDAPFQHTPPAIFDTLIFRLSGYKIADNDPISTSFGTTKSVTIENENYAQNDRFVTPQSAKVTIANVAKGDLAMLKLERVGTSDAYASPVGVYGVKIEYSQESQYPSP
jgi:hypothetical protein